jgi:hypothetical protein
MNEADIKRKTQMATRRNTSAAWRELARELAQAGKYQQASDANAKADELRLIELETKTRSRTQ